jgi:hypothetical protein
MSTFVVRIQVGRTIQERICPGKSAGEMHKAIIDHYPGVEVLAVYKVSRW